MNTTKEISNLLVFKRFRGSQETQEIQENTQEKNKVPVSLIFYPASSRSKLFACLNIYSPPINNKIYIDVHFAKIEELDICWSKYHYDECVFMIWKIQDDPHSHFEAVFHIEDMFINAFYIKDKNIMYNLKFYQTCPKTMASSSFEIR